MKVRTGVLILILLFSSVLFLQIVKLYTNCYQYGNVTPVPSVNNGTWDSYGIMMWQYYGFLITVFNEVCTRFKDLVPQIESGSQSKSEEWYMGVIHDDNDTASFTGIHEGSNLTKMIDGPRFEEVYELLKESRSMTEVSEAAQSRELVARQLALSFDELKIFNLPSDTDIIDNRRVTELREYPLSFDKIEFRLWETTVNVKLKPLLADYNTELTTELKRMIGEFEFSVLRPHVDSSYQSFNDEFLQLEQLISSINKGDQEGYHGYITRPGLRRVFHNISQRIRAYSDDTIQKLELFADRTLRNLEDFQRYKLNLFEEWGDSIITEWSERMGINDITGASPVIVDLETWRDFVRMKSRVIQARDALVRHEPDLLLLRGYIRKNTIQLNETIVALNSRLKACIEDARREFTRRYREENSIDAQLLESIAQEIANHAPTPDW